MTKRDWTAALLESAGMMAAVVAGWIWQGVALGLAVAAVSLIVLGLAVERRR